MQFTLLSLFLYKVDRWTITQRHKNCNILFAPSKPISINVTSVLLQVKREKRAAEVKVPRHGYRDVWWRKRTRRKKFRPGCLMEWTEVIAAKNPAMVWLVRLAVQPRHFGKSDTGILVIPSKRFLGWTTPTFEIFWTYLMFKRASTVSIQPSIISTNLKSGFWQPR